jgi:hypothetical protein
MAGSGRTERRLWSSEPAAGDGFTVEKVVGIGERFSTDLPDAR